MLLTSVQVQEEDSIPPGLFSPLFGALNSKERPLEVLPLTRVADKSQYQVELFEDRIVGKCQGHSSFFLLDDEIHFTYNEEKTELRFQNQENSHVEIFVTENSSSLHTFICSLKLFCPQSSFSDKYEILQEIGSGKKSTVYSAKRQSDNTIFAIKTQTYSNSVREEIKILRMLKHPNLIFFHQYFIQKGEVYIVMDYEDGGNLINILKNTKQFSNKLKIKVVTDLLNALEYLRIKGIVNRDLKPQNILYSATDDQFKIGDFGLAITTSSKMDKIVGTPGYIAPQIITMGKQTNLQPSIKSDIYSMGLIFFQIFTGKQFYQGESIQQITEKNKKGASIKKRMKTGFDISSLEIALLEKMIRSSAQKRKNSYDILKSKTFNKINKEYGLEYSTTCSPSKNKSSEEQDDQFINAVKNLLKIRSCSK